MFLVSFRIRSSREEPAANCGELRIRDTSPDSLSPPHATSPAGRGQQRQRNCDNGRRDERSEWRLLLPGASEPRLAELNPPGLQIGLSNCVTHPEQPEHS